MDLVSEVKRLKRGDAGRRIRKRMREFRRKGRQSGEELFKELCFCILTANYTSEGGIRIQEHVGGGFLTLSGKELAAKLRSLGYRFPNARAKHIIRAREHLGELEQRLASMEPFELREWFASNVCGLGYKEASHFLRNIGFLGFAIIDFHIIDLLVREGLIERPKTMTRKRYLEIERLLGRIAEEAGVSQGELDLYLWYIETGKILK